MRMPPLETIFIRDGAGGGMFLGPTFQCSYGIDWKENGMRLNGLWPVRSHDLFGIFFLPLEFLEERKVWLICLNRFQS